MRDDTKNGCVADYLKKRFKFSLGTPTFGHWLLDGSDTDVRSVEKHSLLNKAYIYNIHIYIIYIIIIHSKYFPDSDWVKAHA